MFATQTSSSSQLCEKPRFSGHKYCSKTCASSGGGVFPQPVAASTPSGTGALCNYCQSKPKFTNFDYCGKYCAAQAVAKVPSTVTQPAQPASGGFNPAQMAQTLAQQFPSMKTYFATVGPQGQIVTPPAAGATPSAPQAPPAVPATTASVPAPPPVPTTCLIPGCGKPAHVDAKGVQTSDFCSKRHREEAVTSGLAEACIMCKKYPQSDKDYFCSRTCKEEATKKSGQ